MVARPTNFLNVGLYSLSEAAFYARIPPGTLARWLFGSRRGAAVLDSQLKTDERLVTFLDFVQALAVRAVRIQHRIPLTTIRKAVKVAEEQYGLSHPFARQHTTYLLGEEIVIRLGDDQYVEASGKHAGHPLLTQVVETYMIDVSYGARGLAEKYKAYQWNRFTVAMDPRIRFGEPLVPSCGYSARALWEAAQAEGGVKPAAKAYGVDEAEVTIACRYYDHLITRFAA